MQDFITAFFHPLIQVAPKIPGALLEFVLGYLFIKVFMFFVKRLIKFARVSAAIRHLLIAIIETVSWIFLVIYILNDLGLGSLVVALTGSAVLIGFILNNGLSQAVSDIFSGISLSRDKDFKVGMKISTNEDKIVGEVVAMNIRKVKIVDDKGKLHVVPNSMFDKNEWVIVEEKEKKHEGHK